MKKGKIFLASFLFLSVLMLVGCNRNLQSGIAKIGWIDHWLNEPVCSLPCWNNITPGQSTAKEGYEQLVNLSDVQQVSEPKKTIQAYSIIWTMKDCQEETGGVLLFDDYPNGKVNSINLFISCTEGASFLDEFLDSFGNPDYSWAQRKELSCEQKLLFLDKGMLITAHKESKGFLNFSKPRIIVTSALLFEPLKDLSTTMDYLGYSDRGKVYEWTTITDDPCEK